MSNIQIIDYVLAALMAIGSVITIGKTVFAYFAFNRDIKKYVLFTVSMVRGIRNLMFAYVMQILGTLACLWLFQWLNMPACFWLTVLFSIISLTEIVTVLSNLPKRQAQLG